ncbi:tail protein X [Acinetobacter courvalinii]|uniref:tail protein X n=1 Tax=Acinetobacter courvalinii TaxID=280147 RepID=UPI0018FF494A|nr:tail protein X [Acinetobacter courvalinii]MBJ8418793.1 tail protein X [Acinetobacter courvalinii]
MRVVKAIQGDTLESIAYRYYGTKAVEMLPALLEANASINQIFLNELQKIQLPELSKATAPQMLKLWD